MKNIFYISSNYFSYNKSVFRQLTDMGYAVTNAELDISEPGFIKRKYYNSRKIKYSEYIKNNFINETLFPLLKKSHPDVVLVSQVSLEEDILMQMRAEVPEAVFIRVLMDDMDFFPDSDKETFKLYDYVTSYYKPDAEKYGFIYNPNFYEPESECEKKFDWSFIGTAPEGRRKILSSVLEQSDSSFYMHVYVGAGCGIKDCISHEVFRNMGKTGLDKYLRSSSLSQQETCRIFAKSRCILDINHPWQKGLSFRPFHAMSMKNKLITTNREIENYDFYDPENIWIMDYDNPVMPGKDFIYGEYRKVSEAVYDYYSIASWCQRLEKYF